MLKLGVLKKSDYGGFIKLNQKESNRTTKKKKGIVLVRTEIGRLDLARAGEGASNSTNKEMISSDDDDDDKMDMQKVGLSILGGCAMIFCFWKSNLEFLVCVVWCV